MVRAEQARRPNERGLTVPILAYQGQKENPLAFELIRKNKKAKSSRLAF